MFETITWLVTNSCILNCNYCRFRNRTEEPTVYKKIEALDVLRKWQESSRRFICLLGGDIAVMSEVELFIDKLNYYGLPYGFQTSGVTNNDSLKHIIPKLKNLSISTDCSTESSRYTKEIHGIFFSGFAKACNPEIDIHSTITIDKTNIEKVPQVVKNLTDLGIWTEITIVHWKKPGFDLVPSIKFAKGLTETDSDKLSKLSESLIKMKRDGYLIHSSENFLSNLQLGIGLNWKCSQPRNCVIDADLSMRLCLHCPGHRVRQWSIFDLTEDKWELFLNDWLKDQDELCPKCFWDCQYEIDTVDNMNDVVNWFDHKG